MLTLENPLITPLNIPKRCNKNRLHKIILRSISQVFFLVSPKYVKPTPRNKRNKKKFGYRLSTF
jgi:hypothetical protein